MASSSTMLCSALETCGSIVLSWADILNDNWEGNADQCTIVFNYLRDEILEKNQKLDVNFIKTLITQALPLFATLPNVLPVCRTNVPSGPTSVPNESVGKLTIVGDLHGQFEDFLNILTDPKLGGFPSNDNQILFNGDLVDRGIMSVEIFVVLMCIKILRPGAVHILRGNHESNSTNEHYGFHQQLEKDYGEHAAELKGMFADLFNALPIAAVIEDTVFVTHGGLGSEVTTIAALNAEVDRFQEPPMFGPMRELLWNVVDARERAEGFGRTSALLDSFDCAATKAFLARNNLQWMIRSHEECPEGYRKQHEDLCWTVFSAPNYCGQKGNLGAVIRFESADLTPTVVQFEAVHYSEHSKFAANRKIAAKGKDRFSKFAAHKKG